MSVLGSILVGLATPTDAAAMGALGAFLLSVTYRRLTRERLKKDLNDLVCRFDQWDLVDVNVSEMTDSTLLAVVSFTADDYGE